MLRRGCDKQLTSTEHWSNPEFRIVVGPTNGRRKVLQNCGASRTVWKDWPKTVKAWYAKCRKPYKLLSCEIYLTSVSSRTGHVKPCLNPEGPPSKAKYVLCSIVYKYREGKVKSTPNRRVK